ncbi:salicylic acid-binding protein 2-like isoform X2 [Andrographis paniculata]|uniref:salicylic acid-binding protein 2-like isoform X2 n=1 Tax=Andrographis paniculata TaxID=175694 RepID=UPI0021E99D67|nr:salicylic acid-binding protein 2-like isoform X2 [Andrographis paniculata]
MDSGKKQQQPHIVLVHGAGHGAWTWYKLKPLLEAAGHRVTAFDLAATGTDLRRLQDLCSFDDYNQPLLEILAAIPPPEKVVLVGHSLGGVNLAAAMERYPDSISVAVFVTAFLPDLEHKPSYVMEQFVERIPAENWEDTQFSPARPPESPLSSMTFGPKFISDRLYNLSPPELGCGIGNNSDKAKLFVPRRSVPNGTTLKRKVWSSQESVHCVRTGHRHSGLLPALDDRGQWRSG